MATGLGLLFAFDPEWAMRLTWTDSFIYKHRFELLILLIELIACLLVAAALLHLLLPRAGGVLAAERRQPLRIVTLPPVRLHQSQEEPTGVYITVSELAAPTVTPRLEPINTATVPQGWLSSQIPLADTPLVGWPFRGALTQGFGCSPFYTGLPGPGCPSNQPWFHDGLDLAAWSGAPVRAALTGTVIFAGPDGDGPLCGSYRGYGLGVVVDNGAGWQALYAHLSQIKVTVGQTVVPETIIGLAGDTGCVTGPHLHFGLRHSGKLVDPELMLAP
jgi:murein DD-endopeptidase MepM/ murein hydrolase activator NlpD